MKIYFDSCSINRLSDDFEQDRIRREADAVDQILALVKAGDLGWCSSFALEAELQRGTDIARQLDNLALLIFAKQRVAASEEVLSRTRALTETGLKPFDALHLACAKQGEAQFLLTTDDRFIRLLARNLQISPVEVINPVNWLARRRYGTH